MEADVGRSVTINISFVNVSKSILILTGFQNTTFDGTWAPFFRMISAALNASSIVITGDGGGNDATFMWQVVEFY